MTFHCRVAAMRTTNIYKCQIHVLNKIPCAFNATHSSFRFESLQEAMSHNFADMLSRFSNETSHYRQSQFVRHSR